MEEAVGPIMALDPGEKRIGVAVSDPQARMALPVATIDAVAKSAFRELEEMVEARNVKSVIVGLPRSLSGKDGPGAERSRDFAAKLQTRLKVPVLLYDERFTTSEAMNAFKITGLKTRKQRPVIDQAAATLLLQGYLDSQQSNRLGQSFDKN